MGEKKIITVVPVDPFENLKGTIIFEAKADNLGATAIWAPNIDPFMAMTILLGMFIGILRSVVPKSNIIMP